MFGSICSSYWEIQQSPWLNPSCFLEGTARLMCYFRERDFNVVNFPPEQLIYLTFASDRFCYTQKSVCIRMRLSKRKKKERKKSSAGLIGKVQTSHIPSQMGHSFCSLLLRSIWTQSLQKRCWSERDRGKLAKLEQNSQAFMLLQWGCFLLSR